MKQQWLPYESDQNTNSCATTTIEKEINQLLLTGNVNEERLTLSRIYEGELLRCAWLRYKTFIIMIIIIIIIIQYFK